MIFASYTTRGLTVSRVQVTVEVSKHAVDLHLARSGHHRAPQVAPTNALSQQGEASFCQFGLNRV